MLSKVIVSLLLAIRIVESSDGLNILASGNDYQITPICVRDVNRIYHMRYRWPEDVRNQTTARDIVILYLTHYGNVYQREYGKLPSRNVLSRIYHCGYEGMKRGEGHVYARRIEQISRDRNIPKRKGKRLRK